MHRLLQRICRTAAALSAWSLAAAPLHGQTTVWTGAASSAWADAANWSAGVPTAAVDATIGPASFAPSTAGAAGATCQALTLQNGAALQIESGFDLIVQAGVSIAGTCTGGGRLVLAGTGAASSTGSGTMTHVEVTGTYSIGGTIQGDLLYPNTATGPLTVAGTLLVTGNATLQGPELRGLGPGQGIFDVRGSLLLDTLNPTTQAQGPEFLHCGGNWTSSASYQPARGRVTFDGSGPQTVTAVALTLPSTFVRNNANLTFNLQSLTVTASLTVEAAFTTPPTALTVQQDLIVTATGSVQVGPGTHRIQNDVTVSAGGIVQGTGTLILDAARDGSAVLAGGGLLGNVRIDAGTGTVTATSVTLAGGLLLQSGTLHVAPGTLQVQGAGAFQGGTITGTGTIGIDGPTTLSGTTAGTPLPTFRVGGPWTADAIFQPATGLVVFDALGAVTVAASDPVAGIRMPQMQIQNGTILRTMNGLLLQADSIAIQSGGTLEPGDGLRTVVNALLCAGDIRLGPGVAWHMGPGTLLPIEPTGSLRLEGEPLARCRIDCLGLGTWHANIAGSLVGQDFELVDLDPIRSPFDVGGIRLLPSSNPARQIALAGGVLAGASSDPAGALLWLQNGQALDLFDLDFVDTGNAPFHNIATTAAPPILYRLLNYDGNLGGPAFESDPNHVVEWISQGRTTLGHLGASSGIFRIHLALSTTREVDSTALQVHRAVAPGGPYTHVATITPLSGTPAAGANYTALDSGLQALTVFHYRIFDQRPGRPLRYLGQVAGRAWPDRLGDAFFVGPGGYADIGAALAVAPPGARILVAAGIYPPFSIHGQPVRILADGSGPVLIDTTAGPVQVANLAAGTHVLLQGLRLGGATAAFGLDLLNCQGSIVLDDVEVTTAATVAAITAEACPRLALQRVALVGGPGLLLRSQSVAFAANSSLASLLLLGQSRLTFVDSGDPPRTVEPGSTLRALAGPGPRLEFPPVLATGVPYTLDIAGDPGDFYAISLGARGFLDGALFGSIDMVLLLLPGTINTALTGLVPASGLERIPLLVPDVPAWYGTAQPVQLAVLRAATLTFRFGNVRDLIVVP